MNKLKRAAALLVVVLLAGLVVFTLYCAVTGSAYFLASLVATLVLPVLLYAYLFIYRLMKGNTGQNDGGKEESSGR